MQTLVSLVGRADPRQPGRIEACAGHAGERPERGVARDDAERAAVLRRDVEDVVRGRVAAGARHVLRDHVGSAGQVAADVPTERARPQVVAAARPEADDHLHRLAGKRIGLRGGRGRSHGERCKQRCCKAHRVSAIARSRHRRHPARTFTFREPHSMNHFVQGLVVLATRSRSCAVAILSRARAISIGAS